VKEANQIDGIAKNSKTELKWENIMLNEEVDLEKLGNGRIVIMYGIVPNTLTLPTVNAMSLTALALPRLSAVAEPF
jgi:hypothetical protein